jgi:hypothetical protein
MFSRAPTQSCSSAALLKTNQRGQLEAADGAAGAHASGQHVLALRVDVSGRQLADVQVGGLNGPREITVVTRINHGVEKLLEGFIRLFIAGSHTHSLDVGVTWVIHASLDDVSEGDTAAGHSVLQQVVNLGVVPQELGHEVGMLGQVRHDIGARSVDAEGGAFLLTVVRSVAASALNPLG